MKQFPRLFRLISLILVILASFLIAWSAGFMPMEQKSSALPGQLLLTRGDGQQVPLGDVSGRLTLLHVWATWCVPCVKELPEVEAFMQQYASEDLVVIPLSLDGLANRQKVTAFLEKNELKHIPPYTASHSSVSKAYKLRGLPTTIMLKEGVEVERVEGITPWMEPGFISRMQALAGD